MEQLNCRRRFDFEEDGAECVVLKVIGLDTGEGDFKNAMKVGPFHLERDCAVCAANGIAEKEAVVDALNIRNAHL
jgi:hypothetical protein